MPSRGGTSAGAPCGGKVRCVGPSGRYRTIGAAVAAARSGDTIQVQAGVYRERVAVTGKAVTLLGGFSAGFARRSPARRATVIDARRGGTTVALTNAGRSRIDGFTITGGRAPLDQDRNARGSGILVADSGAVTIANNLIAGNDDGQDFRTCNCAALGGGIDVTSSVPGSRVTITGNIVRGNRAHRGAGMSVGVPGLVAGNLVQGNVGGGDHGGGLYLGASGLTIRRNLIRGNRIGAQAGYGWGGGAIFFGPGSPTPRARFEGNRWVRNEAPGQGSALFIDEDAEATITGDLFHDNACRFAGAALYVDGTGVPPSGSVARLENVTIAGHACARDIRGSAIFTEGGSRIAVTNSLIAGNGGSAEISVCVDCAQLPRPRASTIAWSLVGGLTDNVTRGPGIRAGDPGFAGARRDDYHLARSSRAIDAASPAAPVGPEPRPNGGRRNLGAYGGTIEATRSR